ncbi:MAG TPA: hypothetical protein VGU63_08500 [Candidatus Acidoferrales bacterium]|nr:hypothetical protein [Candidatus Acidoferrales bacterium]
MPLTMHATNEPRFSNAERKVQAVARRRANRELMRVHWLKFRGAYEEYPEWRALVLWVEAILARQDGVPALLLADLKKRCPGFIEHEQASRDPKLMAFRLLEWIHTQRFGYARRQGWFDALTFYGVRHPRSESAWAYWEHCENEWERKPPVSLPTFEKWWSAAQGWELYGKASGLEVARAVETYSDWQALGLWLRPLLDTNLDLPAEAISELESRCPGISESEEFSTLGGRPERSKTLRLLAKRGKKHCLSEAKQAGWLDGLLERARSDPWHVRMASYAKHWNKEWSRNPAPRYPSFRQWQDAAEGYVKLGSPAAPDGISGCA